MHILRHFGVMLAALYLLLAAPLVHPQEWPLSGGLNRLSVKSTAIEMQEGRPDYWLRSQPQQPMSLAAEGATLTVHHTLTRQQLDCVAQTSRTPTTDYRDAADNSLRVVTNPQAMPRRWPATGELAGFNRFLCHLARSSAKLPALDQSGDWQALPGAAGVARSLRMHPDGAAMQKNIVVLREVFAAPQPVAGASGAGNASQRVSASVLDCTANTLVTLAQAWFVAESDKAPVRALFRSPEIESKDFSLFDASAASAVCGLLAASQSKRDQDALKHHTMPGNEPSRKEGKPQTGSVATVRFVAGSAMALRETVQITLVPGVTLRTGDLIRTGNDAEVHLVFIDGAAMSVRKNTEIRILDYAYDEPSLMAAAFMLVRGTIRSVTGMVAKTQPARYRIETRLATIGVRGTDHEPYVLLAGEDPDTPPGVYNKVNKGESTLLPVALQDAKSIQSIAPGRVGFVRDFAAEDAAARARGEEVKPRSLLLLMPALVAIIPKIFVPAPNESGFESLVDSTEPLRQAK